MRCFVGGRWRGADLLHLENFITGVGIVADVDVVADLGGVDLLVLACEHEACDAHQLQLLPLHASDFEEAVNELKAEIQSLLAQFEREMYFDQPVIEDHSHLGVDIELPRHVVRVNHRPSLVLDLHLIVSIISSFRDSELLL